jgi:hypothetical protein
MSLPPVEIPLGAMRFNSDSQKLEYWNGQIWMQIHTFSPNLDGGVRAVYGNGATPAPALLNTSRYFTIATQGNSVDFGTLTRTVSQPASFSDRTRGVIFGGTDPSATSTSDTITISSTGSAVAGFITLQGNFKEHGGCSNATRGIRFGGSGTTSVDYSTIASGGTQQDFGTFRGGEQNMGAASPTRGLLARGNDSGLQAGVDYITIASTGNAQVYGDLSVARYGGASCSSTIRAVFAGGWASPLSGVIDYFTIASTGNAINFGDLSVARYSMSNCGASDNIRGMFMGGHRNPNPATDVVDYITFTTQGNAVDFGDLDVAKSAGSAVSNGHGGLG